MPTLHGRGIMRDPSRELEILREKLKNGERGGSDADREVLLAFDRAMRLIPSEVGEHRALKLMRHATRMAEEVGGLAEALEDREAAEEIKIWIKDTYDNPETNRDYRVALRMVGKRLGESDEIPESLAWIPTGTPNTYDPTPDPAELLEREDVDAMIDACLNNRDKALIAVAFEAGPEPGSLHELTIGQLSDGDHGYRLKLNGRHGAHYPTLIEARPHVDRWLADHPDRSDRSAPLWSKLTSSEQISYRGMLKALKQAAERAGVSKKVTPRNFRKSNASWLARRGVSDSLINDRQGRKPGSPVISRYVSRFGSDNAEKAYARELGLEVDDDHDVADRTPITCPRCGRETPRDGDFCVFCQQPLDYEAAEQAREDKREVRKIVKGLAAKRPGMVQEALDGADLMDLFGAHPELREEVRSFKEELDGS